MSLFENGLRIIITNKCNYRCFFCHGEGIDSSRQMSENIDPQLVSNFITAGVRDLTISGGEPLVALPALIKLLDGIKSILPDNLKSCFFWMRLKTGIFILQKTNFRFGILMSWY